MTISTPAAVIYVLAGILLHVNEAYLSHISTLHQAGEAALAIFLWPLLLLGIDLRF